MSRYAEAHTNPQGKVFSVTRVSSGIGIETLKALHAASAHVFGTVRDVEKGQAAMDSILAEKIKLAVKLD